MHGAQQARGDSSATPALARMLTAAPDAIALPLFWLCLTVTVTIIFRSFTPWLVIPLTVAGSALTWRWRPTAFSSRFGWHSALAALIIVIAWLAVNLPYASRWIDVTRDPGFLTLEGIWLSDHADPALPIGTAADVAAAVPDARVSSLAYFPQDGALHAQGAKLVPGLVAIGGWIGGTEGVLVGNLLIGAVALVLFYGFARRMIGPVWSLPALIALASSMPMVAFSRSIYTEPLVVGVTFAGLTFLWIAIKSRMWYHYLAGGALVGAGGLARIDGVAIVIGVVLGLAVIMFVETDDTARRRNRLNYIICVGAAFVVTAVGVVDLVLNSPGYLQDLSGEFGLLTSAAVISALLGLLLTFGRPWRGVRKALIRWRVPLSWVAFAGVLVIAAVLLSRPLWYVGHGNAPIDLVGGLQALSGLPVDPTRSYDELSLTWVAMYMSWATVVAALVGVAVALRRSILRRDARLFLVLAVVAAPSLLYLLRVSITPDQIWAMRRFLPVTIPGLILIALYLLLVVTNWLSARSTIWRTGGRIVAGGLALSVVVFPFLTWGHMFTAIEHGGRLGEAESICRAVDERPVVYVQSKNYFYLPTLKTMCGVDVVNFDDEPTRRELREVRAAWGAQDVVVVTFDEEVVPWADTPAPYRTTSIETWPTMLNQRPYEPATSVSRVWLGTIDEAGSVQPIR
ncbi:glycosyltransferase family 39 protein [Agromyces sp. Soil535]|uniref:glycosyltransferase family 39 protein n=1 Tax=Agromyces sp. Soil535 TaxID=1736390 RepID=UPI0006FB2451|nr:glycosyltransferase family 39 protein [Agromyces sp. Soil535]KRE26053.1 hypothetical protein ASG80_04360 [Agromyces sp. Soil535]